MPAMIRIRKPAPGAFIFTVIGCVSVAGCAGTGYADRATAADEPRLCRSGETYSCIERMGRPERCFCADKDTLRELLEPTVE